MRRKSGAKLGDTPFYFEKFMEKILVVVDGVDLLLIVKLVLVGEGR